MRNDADETSFDVMKWLREVRDWIYEETRDMSGEGLRGALSDQLVSPTARSPEDPRVPCAAHHPLS